MSHITGTVQPVNPPFVIGPDFGPATQPPDTWNVGFAHAAAPGGTKLLILHFTGVSLPAANRLEVDLGYGTDVFTGVDGADFWTRPVNVHAFANGLVPIRYIRSGGASGGAQIAEYGRGESLPGEAGHPSISNSDPFFQGAAYTEPTYDPWWFSCSGSPLWENAACVSDSNDVRARVARSVGMIVSVEGSPFTGTRQVSTCSVTLVDTDVVICAGHCHQPDDLVTSSVTFGYAVECGGAKPAAYDPRFYKVKESIAHLNAVQNGISYDFSIMRLAEAPAGIPAVQLRHDIPGVGESVFGVHHPNGAVKKLSPRHATGFSSVVASGQSTVQVAADFSVSGGSSGSGLFDLAGRIVGVLSNGNPCSVGGGTPDPLRYFPTATILQKIATPAPPAVTRDVMVVFDRSGSMAELDSAGRAKIAAARDALSLFVQLVHAGTGNRIGLVSFSTQASSPVDFAIAPVDAAAKTALIGPAPYATGIAGTLAPGGATSIGAGLQAAQGQFSAPGTNPRAILLMTDGVQNTPPLVAAVSGILGGIDVHAIGFGTAGNLDGILLTALSSSHNGLYTRAESGLSLEKFFAHAFGNIFEAGILTDPEYDLPANQQAGDPLPFQVCGEEAFTVVIGWDRADAELLIELTTPAGVAVNASSAGTEAATGRTWSFLRVPLPHGGERDGLWHARVSRPGGGEFPPPAPELRYFFSAIPRGGPQLQATALVAQYYTGESVNPLVQLRYPDGRWPEGAKVSVTIQRPLNGLGEILSAAGLREPGSVSGDTISARQATVAALEQASGHPLVEYSQESFDLDDGSASTRGTFEPAAVFGREFADLLTVEGDYQFHFRASYGSGCTATRELMLSTHVDVGVDPSTTTVDPSATGTRPDGSQGGTLTITPRDRYGHRLGPGRGDSITVTGGPGTTPTGPLHDNGDGSYSLPVSWDPAAPGAPGVVVGQPGRPPVAIPSPPGHGHGGCWWWKILALVLFVIAVILLVILIA